jgi:hypothetical protein
MLIPALTGCSSSTGSLTDATRAHAHTANPISGVLTALAILRCSGGGCAADALHKWRTCG